MPPSATATRRMSRRRRRSASSKRRGGFSGFLQRRPSLFSLVSPEKDPFDIDFGPGFGFHRRDPFVVPQLSLSSRTSPLVDREAADTLYSSSSSQSYVHRNGKTNVVKKEDVERKFKNAQGKTVVERKTVDYATKDGKTVKDVFQHYEIDQDAKGKFVVIKDPAGKVVYKGHVDGKLSTKEKAKRIAALIKRHRQTLAPHLDATSARASVSSGARRDNESVALASMVQDELEGARPSPTRKRSRSASSSARSRSSRRSPSSKRARVRSSARANR